MLAACVGVKGVQERSTQHGDATIAVSVQLSLLADDTTSVTPLHCLADSRPLNRKRKHAHTRDATNKAGLAAKVAHARSQCRTRRKPVQSFCCNYVHS